MTTTPATDRPEKEPVPLGPIRVDARRLGYSPALDGVRAFAVLFIMAFHFIGYSLTSGVPIGVDVFFVMSAFLITNLLLDERNRTGAVSLRGFYHRRILRLFPAMYTVLGVMAVAAIFLQSTYPQIWAELLSAALYSYQLFLAFFGLASPTEPRVLFHLWSLSVEEWFYFLWPVLLIVALRTIRRQKVLIAGCIAFVSFWMLVRLTSPLFGVSLSQEDPRFGGIPYLAQVLYRMSVMRFDALVLGCLLAIVVRRWALDPERKRSLFITIGAVVGFVLILCEMFLAGRVHVFDPFGSFGYNAAILGVPFVILFLHMTPTGLAGRICSKPVLVWVGKRSYGLYLWHEFLNYATPEVTGKVAILIRTAFLFAISMVVAELSWRFIESPFLRRKDKQYGKSGQRGLHGDSTATEGSTVPN